MPTAPGIACPCGGRRLKGHPCDWCGAGKREARRNHDRQRGTAAERGYGWRWRNEYETGAADTFLKCEPLCRECNWWGRVVGATLVDHRKPHRGDMEWFWNADNWQPLCRDCHNKKTNREQRAMSKYVVCGKPGAGKTTWVRQRAKPGDLVFDADYLVSDLFSTPLHQGVDFGMVLVERLRQAVIDWLLMYPDRHAYIIQSDEHKARETAAWLNAELIAL